MIINDLKAYRAKQLELEMLEEKVERLNAQRERITSVLDQAGGVKSSVKNDKLLRDLVKLIDLESEINDILLYQAEEFVKLNKAIEILNPNEQIIIRLYYFEGLKWKEVAKKTYYSEVSCWRIQTKSLEKLNNIFESERK